MGWFRTFAESVRIRAGAATVATLALVTSGLVVQSGVDAEIAWGAPTRVASNLVLNLDGNDTTSLAASSPTSWNSISPATSLATSTLKNVTRYTSGGIGGLTLPAAGLASGGAAFAAGTGAVAGAQTVDMWINPANLATGWNIIASRWFQDSAGGSPAVYDWHFAMYVTGSTGLLRLDTASRTGSNPIYGSQTFPVTSTNTWYHVGFTIDAAGTAQIYVNGRTDGSAQSANIIQGSSQVQLWVGDQRAGSGSMPGTISKFRIYNTALTAAQMQQNFQAESSLYGYPVVTFKSNYTGGPADTFQNVTYNSVTALTANPFTRSGYSFSGWATNANGTGTTYANQANITTTSTSGVDLYAQWTLNAVTPTLAGSPRVGQSFTATAGTSAAASTTSTYQWQRSADGSTGWADIAGATSLSYTPVNADAGTYLRLRQVLSDGTLSATGFSATSSVVLSANHTASTSGVNNAVTDLIAAVPNDSNVVNVTIVSSNLSTGRLKWNAAPANITGVLGADPQSTGYIPNDSQGSVWATQGFPVLSFRGTGANVRTAMATLNYTSTTVQTDTLRIYVNSGSSQDAHPLNYIPIVDNGNKLTFHYYVLQTQTARSSPATQTYLQSQTDLGSGVVSPNKWHLMTGRYWIEENRGWGLSAWAGTGSATNVLLGGYADAGSANWYYPAGTDGYSTSVIYANGTTGQNGLYAPTWVNQDAGTAVDRAMEYWCNNCSMSNGTVSGSGLFWGWDDIPRSTAIGAYIAETWSSTPLSTSTTSTAAQTVRIVTAPDAPTGLTAATATPTSVTLNWTAPASSGTDAITDYTVQTSTDQSSWTTFADGVSTATSATVTGLTAGQTYWFRVAAVTSVGGPVSAAASAFTTATGATNSLTGYSVQSNLTGTIRVLLWTSNPAGKLYVTSATNIDGGIRNTANYPDTTAYTPINGFNPATILSAGRMIGLVDTSVTDLNNALATLKYSSATASTDTIRMWVSNGSEYIPIANGSNVEFHYYGYVGSSQTWANARNSSNAGAARTIDGESVAAGTPFLATARYRAEEIYLKSLNSSSAWLNAADYTTVEAGNAEGSWKWYGSDTGGNTGVPFWSGSNTNGSVVNGEYQDWVATSATSFGEPNGGTGENCLGYNGGGTFNTAPTSGIAWNDFSCSGTVTGYYWEAFKTNAPYGSNTSNPAAANYATAAMSSSITVNAAAAAPTGLTASSTTAGQIDLSWTAPVGVSGITSYSVQTSTDGSTWSEQRGSASTTTSQSISGLTSGTYYQIRVAAITSSGTGLYASTHFTPNGTGRVNATTNTGKTVGTLQVDTALGARYVRVVLRATNANATLKLGGSTANIGTQRGTANASSITAAGQMIGLTGTVANVNTALQGLVYTGPSTSGTDAISMWVSAGNTASTPRDFVPVVNSRGEVEFHYFGFTNSTLTWQGAANAAANDTTQINGVNAPGKFLATLESLDQQTAAMQYYSNGAWLGGGDYTTVNSGNADGAWYWLGPDTGVSQFYSGSNTSGTGGIVNGSFVAWGASSLSAQAEPNNGVQQNCLATIATTNALTNSGFVAASAVGGYAWDDGTCTSTQASYVWEVVSNEPIGASSVGDNYTTMTAQAVLVNPNADAPTGVSAAAAGTTSVAVGWTAPTVYDSNPLTGYTVQVSTSSSFTSSTNVVTGSTATSTVVTGLTANTTYYFRVFATGSGWTGLTSAATGAVTTPSSATSITVVATGGGVSGTDYTVTGGVITAKSSSSVSIDASALATLLTSRDVQLAADTVTIAANVSWSANTRLSLGITSLSTVAINADVSASGATAGLVIAPAACTFSSAGTSSGCTSLDVKSGANIVLSGSTPSLSIGGTSYTVVNTAAQVRALSSNAGAGSYALTNDVDLSGTTATASIAFSNGLTGTFDGLGNTVRGLTANANGSVGFIQALYSPGVIRNLGVNANITLTAPGANNAIVGAGVVAFVGMAGSTTMDQVWSTGSIQTSTGSYGAISIGGLAGNVWGSSLKITRSWSSMNLDTSATPVGGSVTVSGGGTQANSPCLGVGGLVGSNTGGFCSSNTGGNVAIEQAYSTGSVKRGAVPAWHGVGGIFGVNVTGSTVTMTDVFSWSRVSTTDNLTSVGGITGINQGTQSLTRTYTAHSACVANTTATGCTANVRPGTTGTYSTAAWSSTGGTTLANVATPTIALFVRPTAPTDGSAGTVGYSLTDSAGNDFKSLMGTTGYPTLSGSPTWDTLTSTSAIGSYSVTYASGLSLSGTNASAYSINPAPTATSISITKVPQTISWSPTTTLTRTDTGIVLPAATTDGNGTISYAATTGTANCTFASATRTLTFTATGSCDITVTAAASSSNLQATLTRTFTIGNAAPLAPTGLTVVGGVADGRLDVSWTAPSTSTTGGTISSYTLEYSTDGTNWTAVTGILTTSTTISGLSNGTPVTARVRAVNSQSMTGAWATSTATTPYWTPINTGAPTISGSAVGGLTLTASDGSWSANGGTITATSYQWQRNSSGSWVNISGATSASYTVSSANDTGATLRVVVSKTNGANSSAYVSASSVATATVQSGLASAPTISSVTPGNQQLTVSWTAPSTANGGTISSYTIRVSTDGSNWQSGLSGISASATSATVTGLSNGTGYFVQVLAVTAAGDGAAVNSATKTTPATTATNTVLPAITGTVAAGVALAAGSGTWTSGGATVSYSYQWQSAATAGGTYADISGATANSYTPVAGDVGRFLRVVVTATNSAGATTATSAASTVVQSGLAAAPTNLASIPGDGQLTLSWTAPTTLNGGTISTYNVYVAVSGSGSWTQISRATSTAASQLVSGLTNGTAYDVKVEAVTAAGAGTSVTLTASNTSTPFTSPLNTVTPSISGTAARAVTLTASAGTWNGYNRVISYAYQWQRSANGLDNWSNITGATTASYTPGSALVGVYLRVVVTADNTAPSTSTAVSAATAAVQSGLADAPTLGDITRGDRQITVNWSEPASSGGGTISAYTVQYSTDRLSWQTASSSLSASTRSTVITGLTNGTGYVVRVFATTAAGDGAIATAATATTPSTTGTNTALPALSGTAAVGVLLTASNGTWTTGGDPLSYSIQWQSAATAGGTYADIAGATSASYTPVAGDQGRFLRAVVTATNVAGSISAISLASAAVQSGLAGAPSALTPVAGNGQLALSWSAPTVLNGGTISTYNVYWAVAGSNDWNLVTRSASNLTSQTITGLVNGTAYDLRVEPVTAAGVGTALTRSATTASTPFTTPVNVSAPSIAGSVAVARELIASPGTWNDYGHTATFSYQWQTSANGVSGWTSVSGATSARYTVRSADLGSFLRVRVTADNGAASTGVEISAPTVVVQSGLASAPQNLVVSHGDRLIELSWDAPETTNGGTILSYAVDVSTDWLTWSSPITATVSGTSATISDLTNGTGYFVRVRAVTAAGTGSAVTSPTATTPSTLPSLLSEPSLPVTPAVAVANLVHLGTWDNGGAAISFSYRWQASMFETGPFEDVPDATGSSYVPVPEDEGRYLRVIVTASNVDGSVSATSAASAVVTSGRAFEPSGLTSTPGDGLVSLTWTAPTELNGGSIVDYRVSYAVAGTGEWSIVPRAPSSEPSQIVTGLTNGTAYDLRIEGITAAGLGLPLVLEASVDSTPFTTPENVEIPELSGVAAVSRTLSVNGGLWNDFGHAPTLTFQWQISRDSGASWTDVPGATDAEYTVSGEDVGAQIRARVTASNGSAEDGVAWSEASALVESGLPGAPSFTSFDRGDAFVDVHWAAPEELNGGVISGYILEFSSDGDSWTRIIGIEPDRTVAVVAGLSNGTDYRFRLIAVSAAGEGDAVTSIETVRPATVPSILEAPSIVGIPAVARALESQPGAWADNGEAFTVSYQWQVAPTPDGPFTDIDGAVSERFVPTDAEAGQVLRLEVSARNAMGWTTAASAPTALVATGLAEAPGEVGSAFQSSGSIWIDVNWSAPTELNGATEITGYVLELRAVGSDTWRTLPDVIPSDATSWAVTNVTPGVRYDFRVAARTAAGVGAFGQTSSDVLFGGAPSVATAPEVLGERGVGETLRATAGLWDDFGVTITATSVRWQRLVDSEWLDIAEATDWRYTLTAEDAGLEVRAVVTVTNQVGATEAPVSAGTIGSGIAAAPEQVSAIDGDGVVALFWAAPLDLRGGIVRGYRVEFNDGSGWQPAGADYAADTRAALVTGLTNARAVAVRVRAITTLDGEPAVLTGRVPFAAPIVTAAPLVSGPVAVGETLSVADGTWFDNGRPLSEVSVQWQSSANGGERWEDVPGATESSFRIPEGAAGITYRALMSRSNEAGSTVATSAATSVAESGEASAPTGLSVTRGDRVLGLRWTAPTELNGGILRDYRVEMREVGATEWRIVPRIASIEPSQSVDGLRNGVAMEFRVTAMTGVPGIPSQAVQGVAAGQPLVTATSNVADGLRAVGYAVRAVPAEFDVNDAGSLNISVRWEMSSDGETDWQAIPGATAETFTPTAGQAGAYLRLVTVARNSIGSTEAASAATAVIGSGVIDAPTVAAVTDGGASGAVDVRWNTPTGPALNGAVLDSFRIETSTNGGDWVRTPITPAADATSARVTGLPNGADVRVRIRSVSTLGVEGAASAASDTVIPYAEPLSDASPQLSGRSTRGYLLSTTVGAWNPNGRALTSTEIQWEASRDGGVSWQAVDGATAPDFTPGEAEVGALLRSRVTVRNLAGAATAVSAASAVIASAIADAPTTLSVTPGDTQLSVRWVAPSQLNGGEIVDYRVELSTDGVTWTRVERQPSTAPSQTITGLSNGTAYVVRVAALTTVAGVPTAPSAQIVPFGRPINTELPALSGVARIGETLSATTGSWLANGRGLDQPTMQWQQSADGGQTWTAIAGATASTYRPIGVLGKLVRAVVTARNLAGETAAASAASTAIGIGTPDAPSNLVATTGDLTATLNWTPPTALADGTIQNYTVELNDGSGWRPVTRTPSRLPTQLVTGLTGGTTYQFRVRTETGMSSAWSNTISFTAIGKPENLTPPVITGTPLAGSVLSSTIGTWGGSGLNLDQPRIQWQQSLDSGATWTDVAGATTPNITAVGGRMYRTSVSVSNAAGSTIHVSAATPSIVSARPSGVRLLTVVPGDRSLSVSWTVPDVLGGGSISDYRVRYSTDGDTWQVVPRAVSAATSQTITGLVNGVDYYVRVQAVTSVTGSWATASGQFRPFGAPIAQGGRDLISGSSAFGQTLIAAAGSWDYNGAQPAATQYQWQESTNSGTTWTDIAGATASSMVVSSSVGSILRVQVTAVNQAGQRTSVFSDPTAPVTAVAPAVPQRLTVQPGDGRLTANWATPSSLGGSALVGYTVQLSLDGTDWTPVARTSPLALTETITGLDNGTEYYVRVRAETSRAGGWASSPTALVPFGLPINTSPASISGTPRFDLVLTASTGAWNDNGSATTLSTQWQSNAGAGWVNVVGATSSQYTVGAVVGARLRAVVTATNAAGSTVSVSEPTALVVAAPPGAVGSLAVSPADQALLVTWMPPTYLGGSPITDYVVEYSTDGLFWAQSPRSPSATPRQIISGLTNGTAYQVRVRASNGVVGIATVDSTGATPRTVPLNTVAPFVSMNLNSPTAPQIGRAITADQGTWQSNGATVTSVSYQWQVGDGVGWSNIAGATGSSYTPTGNVGRILRVLVTATNASGSSTAPSLATAPVLPAASSEPLTLQASLSDRSITLTWAPPTQTGGAPITDYEVQISLDADQWTTVERTPSTQTSQTISGLENGSTYYVRVRALNGVTGSWAFASDIVPRGVPLNTALPVVTGDALFSATLSASTGEWDDNGAATTALAYQWQSSVDGVTWSNISGANSPTYTVGLFVGSTIRVQVRHTNAAGSTTVASLATAAIAAIPAATPVLTSQRVGNGQLSLGWTPPVHSGGESLAGYSLEYSSDQENWTRLSFGPTVTAAVITGLTNGTAYFARIRAETDMAGEWSPIAGPFVPAAPPVVVPPRPDQTGGPTTGPIGPSTPQPSSPADRTLLDDVMPIALTETTLASLTGPSGVTVTADGRIELQPTQSVALKNGQPLQANVTLTETGLIVETDTVSLALAFATTTDHATTAKLAQGSSAQVNGSGFAPGTPVVTWIQSTPTRLGAATADDAGDAQGSFTIPESIDPGPHTIQVNGVDAEGDVVSVIYGVDVQPPATVAEPGAIDAPVSPFRSPWFWWGEVGVIIAAVGILWLLSRRKVRA